MSKLRLQKVVTALLVAVLLVSSFASLASAATPSAPFAQGVRTKTVSGSIKGGEFAKIWLGLEPEQSGATVTVVAEWDRENASSNGVGFFILNEEGLKRVGDDPLSAIAMAGGNSSFFLNGASNVQGASFNAIGLSKYTLVVYNDSGSAANFKLTATNGFISDDSGQVTDPNAQATTEPQAAPSTATAPAASQAVTTTKTTTTTTAAPAATTAVTAPSTTTTTAAPEAVAAPKPGAPVSAKTMEGDLPILDSQHFIGLTPSERDGEITLRLLFDPQDSSELARRLNFWVLDNAGFGRFQGGSSLSEVAIAAGNRTFNGDSNERVANFKSVNFGPYTVIVENKSRVPASYRLTVDGGLLLDDSGQTKTAQSAGVSATAAVTGTTATAGTTTAAVTAPATTAATTAAPAAGTAGAGKPGGTYTVKSGDSLSTIARDIYGDLQLYKGICDFNGIANCDVIEVGDVINLPTTAQLNSGATAPAATAPKPTPTPAKAPAATKPVTTTAVTATAGVTTTAEITPTATLSATKGVTTTELTTNTATVDKTSPVTATKTSTTTSPAAAASNDNLVDVLTADGRFTSLVKALQATGLDKVLKGRGPFTIFAPTDAAFGGLPKGAFEQLLADPGGQLKDILLYHVVSSKTMAADISNNLQATTVQGKPVKFTVKDGGVRINSAGITETDIEANNGVIHVIDTVILPPPK